MLQHEKVDRVLSSPENAELINNEVVETYRVARSGARGDMVIALTDLALENSGVQLETLDPARSTVVRTISFALESQLTPKAVQESVSNDDALPAA